MQQGNHPTPFIGRQTELAHFQHVSELNSASLVVINGRRRVGKSRLVQEFANDYGPYFVFSGLPPESSMTAQDQRDHFARLCGQYFGLPGLRATDWGDLFSLLAKQTQAGKVIILLDEITWMADDDPTFLGKLKTAWDTEFKNNPNLVLVLCGSISAWIDKHILRSTGFLGRPSLHITLKELPLTDCECFWGAHRKQVSSYEKLKILSVTGGIPRYLELINTTLSAEANIQFLCFNPDAPLINEFQYIFSDIYGKRNIIYAPIVEALSKHHSMTQTMISQATGIAQSGNLGEYLNDLVLGGFISRNHTWHIETGNISKLSEYRLKDNYTRFYLKYIHPNREQILKGHFKQHSLSSLENWEVLLGLQFETLVLNNYSAIIQQLHIPPEEIVFDNPYFQRKTTRKPGCQIDYLIQTRFNTIYLCEIKFRKNLIGNEIIPDIQEKIQRLKLPKRFSVRPVLIHVNGVTDNLKNSRYFSNIIDFGELLNSE